MGPDPWCSLSLQQKLIPNITDLRVKEEENSDPIEDMGKYVYTILDSDDENARQCKKDYNTALAMNTKVHIIHDNLKHLSENEKEEIKENKNPKSEERFEEIWDLSNTKVEDSSVKNLCENLEKLNLEENQESDNSESSTDTVIEKKEENFLQKKKKCEKLLESDASLSPIPGGEESSIVHSPGMESENELDSTTGMEERETSPQTLSGRYRYVSQV